MTLGRGRGASTDNQGFIGLDLSSSCLKASLEFQNLLPKSPINYEMSISIDFQDFISWNQISKGHVQQIKPLNWIEKTEMTIQTPTPPAAGDSASHVLSATSEFWATNSVMFMKGIPTQTIDSGKNGTPLPCNNTIIYVHMWDIRHH